jgi:hypothetical protein
MPAGTSRAIARAAGVDPGPLVREYDDAREPATQETFRLVGPGDPAGPGRQ